MVFSQQDVRRANELLTRSEAASNFFHYAHALVRAKGDATLALEMARDAREPERVQQFLKTAVDVGTTQAGSWGAALAPYKTASNAFSESLRQISVFDAMLPSMRRVPLRSGGIKITSGATGGAVNESSIKSISSLAVSAAALDPLKVSAILVLSEELARLATPSAVSLFNAELQSAISKATDARFVGDLVSAASATTGSAGSSTTAINVDAEWLLASVTSGADSKLFFIVGSANARRLLTKMGSGGNAAFPGMTPNGGTLFGVPCLVSDQIAATTVLLVDASAIVGDADVIELDGTRQAALQLDTDSDSPVSASTTITSLWQADLRGLRAERFLGYEIVRDSAVAAVTGVNWSTGNSP